MSNGHKLNGYSGGADRDERGPGYKSGRGHSEPSVMAEGSSVDRLEYSDTPRKEFPLLNPFTHKMHLNLLQKVQVAVMTVTLVPVRLVLIAICLAIAWFFSFLCLLGRTEEDEQQPITGCRRSIRLVAFFFARVMFFVAGFHWVTVKGKRATPAEAPILVVAPHTSYFDSQVVVDLVQVSVISRMETLNLPVFGTMTKLTQPVFVSREDPSSRQKTVREIQRRAATGGKWPQILLFPEGTTTNGSCLIYFKLGAFIPGVPVQPVCLRYKNRLNTVVWTWKSLSAYKVMWLTLSQFHNRFEIEFLPVYAPSEEEKKDVQLFAYNVRSVFARVLGVPTTENSLDDARVMRNADVLELPNAQHLVHISRIVRQLGITRDEWKELLSSLCDAVTQSPEPSVTLDELAVHLKSSPSSPHLQELFLFYLKAGENVIDLRTFVIHFYLLALPKAVDDFLQFCFRVYDRNKKGFLVTSEVNELLDALGVPQSAVKVLANSGDGLGTQVSYEGFKKIVENFKEYNSIYKRTHSADKRHAS